MPVTKYLKSSSPVTEWDDKSPSAYLFQDNTNASESPRLPHKRGRACAACSRLKIKCELGSTAGLIPPCARCVRLRKDCPQKVIPALPTLLYAVRVAYALYLLAKLHIAATGKGNTYGSVLNETQVGLQAYIEKVIALVDRQVQANDSLTSSCRILWVGSYMKEWLENVQQHCIISTSIPPIVSSAASSFDSSTIKKHDALSVTEIELELDPEWGAMVEPLFGVELPDSELDLDQFLDATFTYSAIPDATPQF